MNNEIQRTIITSSYVKKKQQTCRVVNYAEKLNKTNYVLLSLLLFGKQ